MSEKYEYSISSAHKLNTCHRDLQTVFRLVLEERDHTIICGYRSREAQDEAFASGASKVQWPNSKHNSTISMAVDAAPYFPEVGIDWKDEIAFAHFAGYVMRVADQALELGLIEHKLRWGGDWDMDGRNADQRFNDLVHYELLRV